MANEKRLIDANAPVIKEYFNPRLIDYREFVKECNHFYENPPFPHPATPWHKGLQLAVEIAMRLPKVDAVEVVRCYFCKHYNRIMGTCMVDRKLGQTTPQIRVKQDDFCSYGERREGE